MGVLKVLPMTGGEGETSYSMNSGLQNAIIAEVKPFVQNTITDLYRRTQPKRLTVADLGCSSGPNTLMVISEIVEAVHSVSQELGHKCPEFQVLLSDLPTNDFNTLFKSIPSFLDKLKEDHELGACFLSAVPGSFYSRLFPDATIDFVHASYCLHILSQNPPGIENKGHIYLTTGSSQSLIEAYWGQFQKDFSGFLTCRAAELVPGGRMVITLMGRTSSDPTSEECCDVWELAAKSLYDLVSEGRVDQANADSFNWPGYYPCPAEISTIVQEQGSFILDSVEAFDVDCDVNSKLQDSSMVAPYVSRYIRAIMEYMFAAHFGEEIIEDLFNNFTKNFMEYLLTKGKPKVTSVIMCLRKKA